MDEKHTSRLTGDAIKAVRLKFYDKLNIPEGERIGLPNGWFDNLKLWQDRTLHHFHGEAGSAPLNAVLSERNRAAHVISAFLSEDNKGSLHGVWNADETSFFYAFTT